MSRPRTAPTAVQRDRAVGAVVASAAGDALGAPHEFGPALAASTELAMTGGGSFGWAPGEWTDDTQQALAVLTALADRHAPDRDPDALVAAVGEGLVAWFAAGPRDVGNQTRAVLGAAARHGTDPAVAAADHQRRSPLASGNGSLMRTGPIALADPADEAAVAELAAAVSALTHPHHDCLDACVLWSTAIARAVTGPDTTAPDWVDLVAAGLGHLPGDRRPIWAERLEACRTTPPEVFTPNGWVVTALQAALASLAQTAVPAGEPAGAHLRLSVERAVRIGDDADTVAAIAGALAGAHWGATAVPHRWRRPLHGQRRADEAPLHLADLDALARLAHGHGPDPHGWPGAPSLVPHYRQTWPAPALAVRLDDHLTVGNVFALPAIAADHDAVVSLCRVGTDDVPAHLEHHVVGLHDTVAADNPNLAFVLADTADLLAALAAEDRRVFLHCVQAEHRTPAVAAAHLVRHGGLAPADALARVESVTGTRPQAFLADAVTALGR